MDVSTRPRAGDPCLTVQQPYASMLVRGEKAVEYRSWPWATCGPLWVHAATKKALPEARLAKIKGLGATPVSVVVGRVEVLECCKPGTRIRGLKWWCDHAPANSWLWLVGEYFELEEPIPASGRLGIWKW